MKKRTLDYKEGDIVYLYTSKKSCKAVYLGKSKSGSDCYLPIEKQKYYLPWKKERCNEEGVPIGSIPFVEKQKLFVVKNDMKTEEEQELIQLAKENNAMLKEIVEHVRNLNGEEYKAKHLLQEFINNVVADLFADMLLQPKGRGHVTKEDITSFINQMK